MSDFFANNPFKTKVIVNKNTAEKRFNLKEDESFGIKVDSALWRFYKLFMKKSNVFIIQNSTTFIEEEGFKRYHIIPSKGERVLLINADMSSWLQTAKLTNLLIGTYSSDWSDKLISFQFDDCAQKIKAIHNQKGYGSDVRCDGTNYFIKNDFYETIVPKLAQDRLEDYFYPLDFYNETYIDLYVCTNTSNNDDYNYSDDDDTVQISDSYSINTGVFNMIESGKPIDFLIRNDKFLAFQQNGNTVKSQYANKEQFSEVVGSDATVILRSYNFHYFNNPKEIQTLTQIIRNDDGEYWLSTKANFRGNKIVQIFESLERLR